MDPRIIEQFWNRARQALIGFRASQPMTVEQLKPQLEQAARDLDSNRRTSLYNIPSLYEVEMNRIMGDVTYCAAKWLKEGKPNALPTV